MSTKGKAHIVYNSIVVKLYWNLESYWRSHLQSPNWLLGLQLAYLFSRKQNGGRKGKRCALSFKTFQKFYVTFCLYLTLLNLEAQLYLAVREARQCSVFTFDYAQLKVEVFFIKEELENGYWEAMSNLCVNPVL